MSYRGNETYKSLCWTALLLRCFWAVKKKIRKIRFLYAARPLALYSFGKGKGSSIYCVRKIFWKTIISNPLIRTRMCEYQGVRNVSFSKNLVSARNRWSLRAENFSLQGLFCMMKLKLRKSDLLKILKLLHRSEAAVYRCYVKAFLKNPCTIPREKLRWNFFIY